MMTNKRIISFPKSSLNMYKDTWLEFGTADSGRSGILLFWVTVVKRPLPVWVMLGSHNYIMGGSYNVGHYVIKSVNYMLCSYGA